MTSPVVNLLVTASIPIDCDFWSEDDCWSGLCNGLLVTVMLDRKWCSPVLAGCHVEQVSAPNWRYERHERPA